VGAKGSRVRMVVNELKGEKIDVVEWSEDTARFVAKALAPASVKEVRIDQETQTALVIVPDYQLSLAIGKEGQNARLAARLTGWRIDIKSEGQLAEEEAAARAPAPQPRVEQEAQAEKQAPAEQASEAPAEQAEEASPEEASPEEAASGEPSPQTLAAATEGAQREPEEESSA
jgi:transcription termination/antitermination protein NusA